MSSPDVRLSSSASIPRPRTSDTAPIAWHGTSAALRPWEPWPLTDGGRPSTQYWDVETACWRSHDAGPRRAD